MFAKLINLYKNARYLSRVDLPATLIVLHDRSLALLHKVRGVGGCRWGKLSRAHIPDHGHYASRTMDVLRLLGNLVPIVRGSYAIAIEDAAQHMAEADAMLKLVNRGETQDPTPPPRFYGHAGRRFSSLSYSIESITHLWRVPLAKEVSYVARLQIHVREKISSSTAVQKLALQEQRRIASGFRKVRRRVVRKVKKGRASK